MLTPILGKLIQLRSMTSRRKSREFVSWVLAGSLIAFLFAGCSSNGTKTGPASDTSAAATLATAASLASITISAPNGDNLWYAVYSSKKGRDKILEDLTGIPNRTINPIRTLKKCVATLSDSDVPVGASGAVTAVYYDSKTGAAVTDRAGKVVIECIRGQKDRPLEEMTLDEPIDDNTCSGGPSCTVWKSGVQYCRC